MASVTYFFIIREISAKTNAVESQMKRIAQNIATMQLLDRQEWNVYQNYISQLMEFNRDIVYIAIYDDRNALRAHTLNTELIEIEQQFLTRSRQASIIRRLDTGAIAEESKSDLRTERVNIQVGERILGSVHVGFSLIGINEELQHAIRLNIGLGIFFIFFFNIISFFIGRRLTKPLERLNRAMKAVNEGDLEQKVKPETRDEIAELTVSFNEMIDGLREREIIDDLGNELGSIFQLENLAPLVRDRLKNAIGASGARLYIKNRNLDGRFYEITVIGKNKGKFQPIKLTKTAESYLTENKDGFMIHSAPQNVLESLKHKKTDENGLVMPMTVKDELFGLLFFALPEKKNEFEIKQRRFAATLAGQAALALENAFLYEDLKEQERLKRELEIAREVQKKLLPDKMPEIPGFQIDGICQSAFEVGGDYFDFFRLNNNQIGIAIADVTGKGTSASFYMAELKGMMLQLTSNYLSPKNLLIELNTKLFGNLDRQMFITMTYAILDFQNRKVTFSRAGHNPLLRMGINGNHQFLTPSGIGLGLESGELFRDKLEEVTLNLDCTETLVFYTDGITEAMNPQLEEFGEERLLEILFVMRGENVIQMREHLLKSLNQFIAGATLQDDITMVILKCK
jgi:serine phosphatase RsbU (regulator of sigma subunit)/HAMP domain-containing protein